MIMRFFKPKAELEVHAPATCALGDAIQVEVNLNPGQDMTARQVRVEVVGREAYQVTEQTTDNEGRSRTETSWATGTVATIPQVLQQDVRLGKGNPQHWTASLTVPANAPPTSKGKAVNFTWVVRAVLDVQGRRAITDETPLVTSSRAPAGGLASSQANDATDGKTAIDECILTLDLQQATRNPGEPVIGRVQVQANRAFQTGKIKAELICAEVAGDKSSTVVASKQDLAGQVSFNSGEARSYDFTLALPADAQPTAVGIKSRLRWQARVSLDRGMVHKDWVVQREVRVYSGAGMSKSGH